MKYECCSENRSEGNGYDSWKSEEEEEYGDGPRWYRVKEKNKSYYLNMTPSDDDDDDINYSEEDDADDDDKSQSSEGM